MNEAAIPPINIQSILEASPNESKTQNRKRLGRFSITYLPRKETKQNRFTIHKSVRRVNSLVKSPSFEVRVELMTNQSVEFRESTNKQINSYPKILKTSKDFFSFSEESDELTSPSVCTSQTSEIDDLINF